MLLAGLFDAGAMQVARRYATRWRLLPYGARRHGDFGYHAGYVKAPTFLIPLSGAANRQCRFRSGFPTP